MNIDIHSFLFGLLVGVTLIFVIYLFFYLIKPWRYALFSGCHVPFLFIMGMKFRGSPPMLLIEAYIKLKKSGVNVKIDEVEVLYLMDKFAASTPDQLAKQVQNSPAIIKRQKEVEQNNNEQPVD